MEVIKEDYKITCQNGDIPDVLHSVFPSSLAKWLFLKQCKFYQSECYKFGEKMLSEEGLMKMIQNKQLYAFTHYIRIINSDNYGHRNADDPTDGDDESKHQLHKLYKNVQLNVCVVERVPHSVDKHLKTRYIKMNQIEGGAPSSVHLPPAASSFVTERTPILSMSKLIADSCPYCDSANIYTIGDYKFCTNLECELFFEIEKITLEHFDFDGGDTRRNQLLSSIRIDDQMQMQCKRCDSCKSCKKTLLKRNRRCKKHPICKHRAHIKRS